MTNAEISNDALTFTTLDDGRIAFLDINGNRSKYTVCASANQLHGFDVVVDGEVALSFRYLDSAKTEVRSRFAADQRREQIQSINFSDNDMRNELIEKLASIGGENFLVEVAQAFHRMAESTEGKSAPIRKAGEAYRAAMTATSEAVYKLRGY